MTDKKEKILNVALKLFAEEGYNSTPTSKIAKVAEVSEGLIFKHFGSKQGLLMAIRDIADAKVREMASPILFENNPKEVLRRTLNIPFTLDESEYSFWKLQFKLKWEKGYYNPEKMRPLIDKLTLAFERLGYENPKFEAILLNHILEAMLLDILKGGLKDKEEYLEFLKKKYNL